MATLKQKQAFQKTLENKGVVSKSMAQVGYSPSLAKNPKVLTESKGWQELLEQYLPDSLLLKKNLEGLDATKIISATITEKEAGAADKDFIEVPDFSTRHKYLETGLKVKGKLTDNQVQINFFDKFKEEKELFEL